MEHRATIQLADIQIVHAGKRRFDIINDAKIIRCRLNTQNGLRNCQWTNRDEEMVRYLLSFPAQPSNMSFEASWDDSQFRVKISPPAQYWIIWRRDGSVYQLHPEYARAFAYERLHELWERESLVTDPPLLTASETDVGS